ncbi:MAG: ATP synthase F1 subunit gamma [Sediminibacterium sp.]|nr:ATP synthase F1 subunit gamma [Sediminibacterium sp.]
MPSLKEVRNRIVSVGSTMQITSAMKMVSAAKLKRAQDAITQMRPYANKLKEILENVSATLDTSENAYARTGAVKNVLIVAFTSNRGLAGAFNNNIIKQTWQLIKADYANCNVTIVPVGKKVYDAFKRTEYVTEGGSIPVVNNELYDKLSFDNVSVIAEKVMTAFAGREYDKVVLVYNQFKNAAVQMTTTEQFLPIEQKEGDTTKAQSGDYIFEPSKEFIVNDLIPRSLKTQFYKAILDSFASEHGARMTAMHKATDNAKSMQRDLKISYNKARQAAITKEILEIVGGAEALNG